MTATAAMVLSGCATAEDETTDSATDTETEVAEEEPEAPAEPSIDSITIWADDLTVPPLEGVAADFEADTGIAVEFVIKEFGNIREEAITAIPTGEGPDLMVGAHDWTGQMVSAGVVAPVELGAALSDFSENAVTAFNYDGALYGMPYAVENIGLICNSDLMPEQPATWDELEDAGVQIALNPDAGDPYHMYPLQTSFGAFVFEKNEDGSYNPNLAMDNEGGVEFAQWLYDEGSQVFDVNAGYDIVNEQILSGELACWITGPWAAPGIAEALGEDGYEIYEIPSVGGETPVQFLGARGFYVSSQTEDQLFVTKFLTEYIANADVQTEIFELGGRIPAHKEALAAASDNKIASGFGAVGVNAEPMPAIPAMNSVWASWGSTQAALLQQAVEPEEAWTKMIEDIETAIAG
jgi:arabinogalactan oligomer/maltooligosaccharide transport system substrate-binding protein